MKHTLVSELTPQGTGGIATIALVGPHAWGIARARFQSHRSRSLPEVPAPGQSWFGKLAGDEVVLVNVPVPENAESAWVEVHSHGGRHVVRTLLAEFVSAGASEVDWRELPSRAMQANFRIIELLSRAPTLRTAGILLDQYHGAFDRAVQTVLDGGPEAETTLARLVSVAPLGRHLITPWRVVLAGEPNVGKSSLANALAGYQRSIVSATAGTTRDVVTTTLAFDGWPVELADTAGLREGQDESEVQGVARARASASEADLVLWVTDQNSESEAHPPASFQKTIRVLNKCDLIREQRVQARERVEWIRVSAKTGDGIPDLIRALIHRLVPDSPSPGSPVPYTPALASGIEQAERCRQEGRLDLAIEWLKSCLGSAGSLRGSDP